MLEKHLERERTEASKLAKLIASLQSHQASFALLRTSPSKQKALNQDPPLKNNPLNKIPDAKLFDQVFQRSNLLASFPRKLHPVASSQIRRRGTCLAHLRPVFYQAIALTPLAQRRKVRLVHRPIPAYSCPWLRRTKPSRESHLPLRASRDYKIPTQGPPLALPNERARATSRTPSHSLATQRDAGRDLAWGPT
ncbi:hypothetical protein SVAN01_06674 [Stagonosporopsis vannaccii]|nr:hypothetical protein SVAN01_06674 [Stagonosporopsis vannaccii]